MQPVAPSDAAAHACGRPPAKPGPGPPTASGPAAFLGLSWAVGPGGPAGPGPPHSAKLGRRRCARQAH
eukprot:4131794-Lingulodinium_polyedra.AAC.1